MARRYKPQPRAVTPDSRYGSKQVSMFVNRMMKDGKKSVAIRIMYDAFDIMGKKGEVGDFNARMLHDTGRRDEKYPPNHPTVLFRGRSKYHRLCNET